MVGHVAFSHAPVCGAIVRRAYLLRHGLLQPRIPLGQESVSLDSSAYLTEKCALRNCDVSGGFGVYACSVIATGDLIGVWSGTAACFGLPKRACSTKP